MAASWLCVAIAALAPLAKRVKEPRLPDLSMAQATQVKRVPRFLSDEDIESLHRVAGVARADANGYTPQATLERQEREGGRTVWINHNLKELLPDLHRRMLQAARDADNELCATARCHDWMIGTDQQCPT